jgi:hypothetical protein
MALSFASIQADTTASVWVATWRVPRPRGRQLVCVEATVSTVCLVGIVGVLVFGK